MNFIKEFSIVRETISNSAAIKENSLKASECKVGTADKKGITELAQGHILINHSYAGD
jgi:hypothetical protein